MTEGYTGITVGSSDVASILGLGNWADPVDVWARLVGILPRYSEKDNKSQRRGRMFEKALLDEWVMMRNPTWFARGPSITQPPFVADGWRSSRPDALADLEPHGRMVVEAKTTRSWEGWGDDGSDGVPIYYAAQVLWQLSVMDLEYGELIAFCPIDEDVRVFPIKRNRSLETRIIDRVRTWLEDHVWSEGQPPPCDPPYRIVKAQFSDGGGDKAVWVDPDPEHISLAHDLISVVAQKDAILAQEDAIRAKLCTRIGEANGIRGLCSWGRVKGRETVDAKGLKKAHPDIYNQFLNIGQPSRSFRLLLKGESNHGPIDAGSSE